MRVTRHAPRLLRAAKKHRLVPVGFIDHELRPERRLPTGQVTLLFVDVEDSTRHLAELEDRYGPMLTAVRRLVRTAVRRAGGHEVDARADEFFAAFADPAAALATARSRAERHRRRGHGPIGREVRVRDRTPRGTSDPHRHRLCRDRGEHGLADLRPRQRRAGRGVAPAAGGAG